MESFLNYAKDAVRYALRDKYAIIIIGTIMLFSTIISKTEILPPNCKFLNIFMIFVIGYGSFISYYTLKGRDEPPKIKRVRRIFWEGIKKTVILMIYSIPLLFLIKYGDDFYNHGNLPLAILCAILFALVYICLIGGLFNRYLNKRQFIKAFYINEIIELIRIFDKRSFFRVLIAVVIGQVFTVSVLLPYHKGHILVMIFLAVLAFFLSPFLYLATKRLIGLNVRNLLKEYDQ